MSYASLINVASGSNQESFQRIRDFLGRRNGTYDYSSSGIGWTLHDSSYAVDEDTLTPGDWVVFTSPGENGRQALYVQFVFQATNIKMQGWLYWNNITHAGVRAIGSSSNNIYTPAGACVLWILGDLDAFWVANSNGISNYLVGFGCIKPGDGLYDNTIAIAPSAVSTGTSVVVPVDVVPASWQAGQKLYHWDTVGINIVTIESVGASSVTLASVSAGKLAGSRLAGDVCVFCSTGSSPTPTIIANRSTAAVVAASHGMAGSQNIAYVNTDSLNGGRPGERVGIYYSNSEAYGAMPHIYAVNNSASQNSVCTAKDGTSWRVLKNQSTNTFAVRES